MWQVLIWPNSLPPRERCSDEDAGSDIPVGIIEQVQPEMKSFQKREIERFVFMNL